jgi:hypothetical protein
MGNLFHSSRKKIILVLFARSSSWDERKKLPAQGYLFAGKQAVGAEKE